MKRLLAIILLSAAFLVASAYVQQAGAQQEQPPNNEISPVDDGSVQGDNPSVPMPEPTPAAQPAVAVPQATANPQPGLSPSKSTAKKISLDIKGMDIVDVLKLLSNQGGLNIVTGKDLRGRVALFLKDVDVWDAFEIIIAANGLAYSKKGDIITVMNDRDYEMAYGKKYDDQRIVVTRKLKFANSQDVSAALNQVKSTLGKVIIDASSNTLILMDVPEVIKTMQGIIDDMDRSLESLETRIFELNYADSKKLKEQIESVLTKGIGVLKIDERTNKFVVIDFPDKVAQIAKMILAFDEKTRQVLIEAKIVQVTLSDDYKMGIDWQYIASREAKFTAFNISRALSTQGAQMLIGDSTPTANHEFKVIVDMLKTFGDVKTLSTPRITATNGQEAKILVGSKKVYVTDTIVQAQSSTTTAEGVQFVDVGVKLYVTPTINKDGYINLKIRPEVSSAQTSYTTARGNTIPIVDTSEAETSVLIKDGATIIMGGLMKNEVTKNVNKLPVLGEIPFLGGLFRRTESSVDKTELVIFLTPHIISGAETMLDTEGK